MKAEKVKAGFRERAKPSNLGARQTAMTRLMFRGF